MSKHALSNLIVKRINTEMPIVLTRLKELRWHVSMLSEIGAGSKSIDARNLKSSADSATREAIQLRHQLTSLAEFVHSVTRKGLGDSYGTFMGNYKGNLRNINKEFVKLEQAISKLHQLSSDKLNDPGRWGDSAAETAVTELFGMLNSLLEFWTHLRVKEKLNS